MRIKLLFAILFAMIAFPSGASAREPSLNPLFREVYFNASYGFDHADVYLAEQTDISHSNFRGNYYDVSIGLQTYFDSGVRLGLEFGFKQEHFHYAKLSQQGGVYLNYIPVRVFLNFNRFFQLGIRWDNLVDSRISSNEKFSYSGLNEDCFNKKTFVPYFAFNFQLLPDLGIIIKYNFAITSALNYEKIDYYNMCHNFGILPLSFEFGINYRIFTTGKRDSFSFIRYGRN